MNSPKNFDSTYSKAWDLLLPHAEFAYNKASSKVTSVSPFKVIYRIDPLSPLDLIPCPSDQKHVKCVEEIQKLHEQVKGRIEQYTVMHQAQANKYKKKTIC